MATKAGIGSATAKAGAREWLGLSVLALACLVYAMDLTVLHLALPAISAALRPSGAELLWIVDIYGYMVAGSLIAMGTLGDRIGRRRLLLLGAAAFGAISVVAAFSTSPAVLITSRAALGIAGATLSLIFALFRDPQERSVAVGVWITAFSIGAAIGPPLGGLLLRSFWWGSVFLLAVPVMGLLLALGPRLPRLLGDLPTVLAPHRAKQSSQIAARAPTRLVTREVPRDARVERAQPSAPRDHFSGVKLSADTIYAVRLHHEQPPLSWASVLPASAAGVLSGPSAKSSLL